MSTLEHPFFVKLFFTFQDDEKLCIFSLSKRIYANKKKLLCLTQIMNYLTN